MTHPALRASMAALALLSCLAARAAVADTAPAADFPSLPPPPAIEGLIGFPQPFVGGRSQYLPLIIREAESRGLPPAVADAVATVESAYRPGAVGGVGEVGLMQVRPQTAALLGHEGGVTALFEPETNIRYGVAYLARAWQLAGGDLCRALMKYRAGHGEERMTPLSVQYCDRARRHLATVGSPLANGAAPLAEPSAPFALAGAPRRRPDRLRVASIAAPKLSETQARALQLAREQEKVRRSKIRQMNAAHEARMVATMRKLNPSTLRIMSGM